MVLILLPIVGYTIVNSYEKHMIASVKDQLSAYSYSILAVAEVEQQQLLMPEVLLENQFNVNQSGLYATFTEYSNPRALLWQSNSLLTVDAPHTDKVPNIGQSYFYQQSVDKTHYFVYSFTVSFSSGENSFPTTLHIIKLKDDFQLLMQEFRQKLWLGLLILMAVLIFLQFVWLKWSLKPLAVLQRELVDIEKGATDKLNFSLPSEGLGMITDIIDEKFSS